MFPRTGRVLPRLLRLPVIVAWLALRHELHTGLKTQTPHVPCLARPRRHHRHGAQLHRPRPSAAARGHGHRLCRADPRCDLRRHVPRREGPRLPPVDGGARPRGRARRALAPVAGRPDHGGCQPRRWVPSSCCSPAVFAALAQVFVRKMVQTESTSAIVFYFSLTATVMSFLTLPWGWAWPPLWVLALLVLAGLLGGIGQILLTSSYRHADASLIAPFEYASMLLAIIVGYVGLLRGPDADDADGGGDDRDGGYPDHLARAAAGPRTRAPAQGRQPAELTLRSRTARANRPRPPAPAGRPRPPAAEPPCAARSSTSEAGAAPTMWRP
jgi:uncharacterized membrane protein